MENPLQTKFKTPVSNHGTVLFRDTISTLAFNPMRIFILFNPKTRPHIHNLNRNLTAIKYCLKVIIVVKKSINQNLKSHVIAIVRLEFRCLIFTDIVAKENKHNTI